jgi:hypothetical protein
VRGHLSFQEHGGKILFLHEKGSLFSQTHHPIIYVLNFLKKVVFGMWQPSCDCEETG